MQQRQARAPGGGAPPELMAFPKRSACGRTRDTLHRPRPCIQPGSRAKRSSMGIPAGRPRSRTGLAEKAGTRPAQWLVDPDPRKLTSATGISRHARQLHRPASTTAAKRAPLCIALLDAAFTGAAHSICFSPSCAQRRDERRRRRPLHPLVDDYFNYFL